MRGNEMTEFYGLALLIALPVLILFYAPDITDLTAGALEGSARILRRHATAMRAAYAAYGASWKEQAHA
jgi:hypothetical protein